MARCKSDLKQKAEVAELIARYGLPAVLCWVAEGCEEVGATLDRCGDRGGASVWARAQAQVNILAGRCAGYPVLSHGEEVKPL